MTKFEKHDKLLKLIRIATPVIIRNNIENKSIYSIYYELIEHNNLEHETLENLFKFFYKEEIFMMNNLGFDHYDCSESYNSLYCDFYNYCYINYNNEDSFVNIINFTESNYIDCFDYKIIDNKKCLCNFNNIDNLKRALKRYPENNFLCQKPYFECRESDQETINSIVTRNYFKINVFKLVKCSENVFLIYYKTSKSFNKIVNIRMLDTLGY